MFPHDQNPPQNFTGWQTAFIRDNLPVIGYSAWTGFENAGWGLLVCQVEPPPISSVLSLHSWSFKTQFVPGQSLAACLRSLEIFSTEIPALVKVIAQYNPHQEIMLLIRSGKSVEVNWLKDLATTPPEYYWQVCDRWDEFMPDSLPPDSSERLQVSLLDVSFALQESKDYDTNLKPNRLATRLRRNQSFDDWLQRLGWLFGWRTRNSRLEFEYTLIGDIWRNLQGLFHCAQSVSGFLECLAGCTGYGDSPALPHEQSN